MIQQIIKKFGELYPDICVEIFINNSKTIREKIDRSELDFALVEEFPQMDAYITEPFFEDRNIVVVPVGHHLLQKENVTAKVFWKSQLILICLMSHQKRRIVEKVKYVIYSFLYASHSNWIDLHFF